MKKLLSVILIFAISISIMPSVQANGADIEKIIEEASGYLKETVTSPTVSTIGGEWAVIALSRNMTKADDKYFSDYYSEVKNYTEKKGGILHERKYTEYSRVAVALTAIGKDPTSVSGYNLLKPLADFDKTVWQGINGAIWAIIAFDSGNYEIPEIDDKKAQATRERYISYILNRQKDDGGWALSESEPYSDVDITAMAIYALHKYCHNQNVKEALDKALLLLSKLQNENGGFSRGAINSESSAQVLIALCSMKIRHDDPHFIKNGKSVLDDLLSYYHGGGFKHLPEGKENIMATEQALCALDALWRFENNKPFLYDMTDHINIEEEKKEVKALFDVNFTDITGHKNEAAIKKLASQGIINGKSEGLFDPESTMTRAEFATIIVKALKLAVNTLSSFEDVKTSDWFYQYVNAAYENKIINGVSEKAFNPYGTITREEAAVMLCRCAVFYGLNTVMDTTAVRNALAGFTDYVKVAPWAVKELAYCCSRGIIDDSPLELLPKEELNRAEIAQMIFELLREADKI